MKYNKWKIFILSCLCALASMMNVKYIQASEVRKADFPKIGRLEIYKLEAESDQLLKGVTLQLWDDDTHTLIEEWKSNDKIKYILVDLNKTYRLKEKDTVKGYEIEKDIVFKPEKDALIDTTNELNNILYYPDDQKYMGFRYNNVRYITDGKQPQIVYCLNKDYHNPDNIDDKTMIDINNPKYPKYMHKSLRSIRDEELYKNQNVKFDRNAFANVLLAGYPSDRYGLKNKYGLSDDQAYAKTQALIDAILSDKLTEMYVGDYEPNQSKYYNELLSRYKNPTIQNADAYIDIFTWVDDTGSLTNKDGKKSPYQMLASITNFYPIYQTRIISASKKKATSLEPNKFTVKKIWDDKGDVKHEKDVVRVQLYEQGKPVGGVVELRADNGWTYTWDDITVKDNYDYELKELDVKLGYTSRVEYDDYNLVLRNTQVEGKVTITKTDEETKSPLPNAEFDITDEQGKLVKKVITNDEGKGSVDLHGGKYFVREVKAPKGYQVSDRSHEVVITKQDEHITLDITNKKEPDKILDEEEAVVEDNTRGDESSDIKHETTSENEEAQPEEDTVVNDRKDSEVKEENSADVDNGKQSEVVDENTSEKEENQSEEDIVVEDTKDLEIKDETSTDIDDRKEPEVKEEIVIEENVSSNGKGDKPKQENNDAIIVKEEQKVPLKKDIEKQAHQDETKNTKYSVMGQKKDSVKSEDKKESKINEKETVNTSDQTNTYMWWLVTASVILMIVCGCKYGLYKKSDK